MIKLEYIFLIFLVNAAFLVDCKSVALKSKFLANLPTDLDLSVLDQTPLADVLHMGLQIVLPFLSQHLPIDEYQGNKRLYFQLYLFQIRTIHYLMFTENGLKIMDILDRLERNGTRDVTFGELISFIPLIFSLLEH